nr:hypothetical protein [Tanacetum cinerariifolium]
MRTRSSSNLIVESFTIPKRRNRRRSKQIVEPELRTIVENPVATMADTRTMSELLQAPTEGYGDDIVIPAILAKNFELKVGLLSLVTSSQFHGFERDDPILIFGAARTWLEKEPPRSIHTWEDLVASTVTVVFLESDALTVVYIRVEKLEYDVCELKKIDHSAEALTSLKSQVLTVVEHYLRSKISDGLQKVL